MSNAHHLVLVTVLDVNDSQFLYPSCERCYSKLTEDGNLSWLCLKCGSECTEEKLTWRYRLSLRVSDVSNVCNVCIFGASLNQFFGDNAFKFHRNFKNLSTDQSNAEEIVHGAVQEVFVGNSFYLRMRCGLCRGEKPVTLSDIVRYSNYESQAYTQDTDNSGLSLVASQIIPVVGKSNTDVSSIVRAVIKAPDKNIIKRASVEKTNPFKYSSVIPEKFKQEESAGSLTITQSTLCLSCDSISQQSCEDSKYRSKGPSLANGTELVQQQSITDDNVPKFTSNSKVIGQVEEESSKPCLPLKESYHQQFNSEHVKPSINYLDSLNNKEKLHISKGSDKNRSECLLSSESIADASCDLFDSTPPVELKSQFSPFINPLSMCKKSAKRRTIDHSRLGFSLKENSFRKKCHLYQKIEVQTGSVFSQELFTPSPIYRVESARKLRNSVKNSCQRRISSSKYLSLLRKKTYNVSSLCCDMPRDTDKEVHLFSEPSRETESPLLFSESSTNISLTSPDSSYKDNFRICPDFLSPDIFQSTPDDGNRSSIKSTILSPCLVKQLFK
ncbi:DNA damage-induced apoptosis suppressor protein-like [Saccostrea cucullata]|uniref:DNA damage-induced apoptosis suppressor protein-like n=1 Tax=Saccostrea cuccullata TaxID=36930 RepID=UPI002ED57C43